MDNFIQQLKTLKKIAPDKNFGTSSWAAIIGAPQIRKTLFSHLMESARYSLALGLGAVIIVITLGGFSYLHLNDAAPVLVSSLNTKSLLAEAENANFEIKLARAKYFDDVNSAVMIALGALSQSTPDHLNSDVLEKEMKSFELQNQDIKNNVDQVLNKIL